MIDPIHKFYCSKEYKNISQILKLKSKGICSECGQLVPMSRLRTHHIIELNLNNIDDVNITLNESNIKVICDNCHNREHRRYSSIDKQVYCVFGAPAAGKTTYVKQVATRYDLIVDLDEIHKSICICDKFDKPASTMKLAYDIRDLLLDRIKTRKGEWECAYIISTIPNQYERIKYAEMYGAEIIMIDTPKADCIKQIMQSDDSISIKEKRISWVEEYFKIFK